MTYIDCPVPINNLGLSKMLILDRFSLCSEKITDTDKTDEIFFW